MSFNHTMGVTTVTCDMCGPDWWRGYEDAQPLFTSRGTALRVLPIDFMWTITEKADGSLHMLCATCTQLEDCVRNGHSWVDLIYTIDGDTNKYGETCSCCSVVRSFDTPPADHPESVTAYLSDSERQWFAALELALTDANEEV